MGRAGGGSDSHNQSVRAASTPAKLVIAYAAMSPRVAPLWAAQERGFFTRNGIDAELVFVRAAPTLLAALSSGDMQVGLTGGTAVLGAAVAGLDLKILAVLTNRVTLDLVGVPVSRAPTSCAASVSARPPSAGPCG